MRVQLDPQHLKIDLFAHPTIQQVWRDKYRFGDEKTPYDTFMRVAQGICGFTPLGETVHELMVNGLFMPAGRILTGAGTSRNVTLMNCYVNGTMLDDFDSIITHFNYAMQTLRRGGGIGTDFSPLRPRDAKLQTLGEGAKASGGPSFMTMWNGGSKTITSAGARRGAMMSTLRCDHPDIEEFITCKHEKGALEHTNISVLVTSEFMNAVKQDLAWELVHPHDPGGDCVFMEQMYNGKMTRLYVYNVVRARDLWDKILRSTYKFSEPGVIFIDRVNNLNNLRGVEYISCTNPCGEQPLPPHGCCLLGAVNLARMVKKPFEVAASVDWELLEYTVRKAIRFLDRVIDITMYPLPQQEAEQKHKRRIGLGIMGLGDALAMMNAVYGGAQSLRITETIMRTIRYASYDESSKMAEEFSPAPVWESNPIPVDLLSDLPTETKRCIEKHGLRNSHLMNIAPTGTTALILGNASGGLEPIFSFAQSRKILELDNTWKEHILYDYAYQVHKNLCEESQTVIEAPGLVSADQLSVQDHLEVQAVCQKYIDASVSKTINIPTSMSFDDFKHVYEEAYRLGCKGCTTYRPSDVRGSILEAVDLGPQRSSDRTPVGQENSSDKRGVYVGLTRDVKVEELKPEYVTEIRIQTESTGEASTLRGKSDWLSEVEFKIASTKQENTNMPKSAPTRRERPDAVQGVTHKIKWPTYAAAIYMTVNMDDDGVPLEVMINTKNSTSDDWIKGFTLMATATMRLMGKHASFLADEWQQVQSVNNGAHMLIEEGNTKRSKFFPSIIAYMGFILAGYYEQEEETPVIHFTTEGMKPQLVSTVTLEHKPTAAGTVCTRCGSRNTKHQEGCIACLDCNHSNCG